MVGCENVQFGGFVKWEGAEGLCFVLQELGDNNGRGLEKIDGCGGIWSPL